MWTVKWTYCILKAEQHRLQAVQRHFGGNQHGTKAQQAISQLFPVRGPDIVSQADNEFVDMVSSERWSLIVLLKGKQNTGKWGCSASFVFILRERVSTRHLDSPPPHCIRGTLSVWGDSCGTVWKQLFHCLWTTLFSKCLLCINILGRFKNL